MGVPATTTNVASSQSTGLHDLIEVWLDTALSVSSLPGLSIAIGSGGELQQAHAFGMANLTQRVPLATSTAMDVASQTKMLTLIALWQLVRQGSLQMEDPIEKYVPRLTTQMPRELAARSINALLTHQSGLPRDFDPVEKTLPLEQAIGAALRRNGPNPFPAYSNIAFAVLGAIVEELSAEPYRDYVQRNILEPLSMRHSTWSDDTQNDCQQYGPDRPGGRKALPSSHDPFDGAVGLWSTPSDMCRLSNALLGMVPGVLTPFHAQMSTAVHWGPSNTTGNTEFGFGLEARWMAGTRWFGHSGGAPGFISATYFNQEHNECFSATINGRDETALGEICQAIAAAISIFRPEPTHATTPPDLERLHGTFEGDLGKVHIFSCPSATLSINPCVWNPFPMAHRLEIRDETVRIAGTDFSDRNTRLDLTMKENGQSELLFGVHSFLRLR